MALTAGIDEKPDIDGSAIAVPFNSGSNLVRVIYDPTKPTPHWRKFMVETIDHGETPEEALIRGLRDECGLDINKALSKPHLILVDDTTVESHFGGMHTLFIFLVEFPLDELSETENFVGEDGEIQQNILLADILSDQNVYQLHRTLFRRMQEELSKS